MPDDFATHPVWVSCHSVDYDEPWYDGTDEETFRPWLSEIPVADAGIHADSDKPKDKKTNRNNQETTD